MQKRQGQLCLYSVQVLPGNKLHCWIHIYIYIYIYIYYVAMVTAGLYIAYTPHQYST